jgi:diguanylate cyclase (GGDEF)-like protein
MVIIFRLRRGLAAAHHALLHDHLTGLPNRLAAERVLRTRAAGGTPVALVLMDLDGFKSVNDTHGHHAGDDVLRAVGARILDAAGPAFAARLHGDEFLLVIPGDVEAALRVTRSVVAAISGAPVALTDGDQLRVGVSAGISHGKADQAGRLLGQADAAMYRAKRGAEPICVYEAPRDSPATEGRPTTRRRDRALIPGPVPTSSRSHPATLPQP